jgi:hypothetical protein
LAVAGGTNIVSSETADGVASGISFVAEARAGPATPAGAEGAAAPLRACAVAGAAVAAPAAVAGLGTRRTDP